MGGGVKKVYRNQFYFERFTRTRYLQYELGVLLSLFLSFYGWWGQKGISISNLFCLALDD